MHLRATHFLLATLPFLVSCADQSLPSERTESQIGWRAVDDNSRTSIEGAGTLQTVRRCWNIEGGWDCLFVQKMGSNFIANRYSSNSLGDGHNLETILSGTGYDCEFNAGVESATRGIFSERISRQGNILAQNTINLNSALDDPWTLEEAQRHIRETNIEIDHPYFDCSVLATVLLESSLSALSSRTLAYDDLMP